MPFPEAEGGHIESPPCAAIHMSGTSTTRLLAGPLQKLALQHHEACLFATAGDPPDPHSQKVAFGAFTLMWMEGGEPSLLRCPRAAARSHMKAASLHGAGLRQACPVQPKLPSRGGNGRAAEV